MFMKKNQKLNSQVRARETEVPLDNICSTGDPREPRPTDLEKVATTLKIVLSDTAASPW